ncbi:MAG: orotidine-5'-phosphate decarboxylase [Alphaproteobacteria bacterium]|nr:orotidine-5'-phosphate decarboxylase [Alphaproteobacteria bacterium]
MANDKIIVALDYPNEGAALELVRKCDGRPVKFKIGKELFTNAGPDIVSKIIDLGGYVFLDLKYNDISNTVKGAAKAAANLGVDLFNMHASAGFEKMKAAKEGVTEVASKEPFREPRVIAVTCLTDMDEHDLKLIGVNETPAEYAARLANLAKHAGMDGVVCSPKELPIMRYILGDDATLVTPGIRPRWSEANEQKRITTPADAIANGATMLVIGRPITGHEDPAKAIDLIADEILAAMPRYNSNVLNQDDRTKLDDYLKQRNMELAAYMKLRGRQQSCS